MEIDEKRNNPPHSGPRHLDYLIIESTECVSVS